MKGELRRSALCNISSHVLIDLKRPVQMSVSFKNESSVKLIKHAFISHVFFPMALQPNAGHGLLILDEVSRSNTTTHHSQQDFSGRVISSPQRPLPDNTQHSQRQTSVTRRDSNPQSQQASGRRPTPQTVRPLGPAFRSHTQLKFNTAKFYCTK